MVLLVTPNRIVNITLKVTVFLFLAAGILSSNMEERKYLMKGVWAPVKTPNCVPHDIGCPGMLLTLSLRLIQQCVMVYRYVGSKRSQASNFSVISG